MSLCATAAHGRVRGMNDATRAAALEAAAIPLDEAIEFAPSAGAPELDAYLLSCRLFAQRVGEAPNAAQRAALLQQVKRGYVDGTQAPVDHSKPAPSLLATIEIDDWVKATDETRERELMKLQSAFLAVASKSPSSSADDDRPVDRRARAEAAAERMDGMTIAEAAAATGHSERAIRARVDRGTLRAWKGPDNKRRIPRIDLVHAGLLDDESAAEAAAAPATPQQGSGSGSAATAATDQSALVLTLWEKAEQAVREATEHRLISQYAETRLAEAEATAKRFEEALHEARSDAAVAKAEAERLQRELDAVSDVSDKVPAHEEGRADRRWWQRRGK